MGVTVVSDGQHGRRTSMLGRYALALPLLKHFVSFYDEAGMRDMHLLWAFRPPPKLRMTITAIMKVIINRIMEMMSGLSQMSLPNRNGDVHHVPKKTSVLNASSMDFRICRSLNNCLQVSCLS